ncbi:MAG: HlyC/CorC family transporter [Alphaproteobacteria bacterium]|nr:HlyC/CorC family transporter [Alphaproteobacteria bacterium]
MLYATLAVLLLLMASAFTSGTETAMTGASRARIHQMASGGNRSARLAKGLLANKETLIGSLLLGNNLFNVLATALAADVLIKLAGDAGIAYATLIMTALVVIFAEVLPKTYAIRNPERMALAVAPLAKILVLVLSPVTHAVQWLINGILRLGGMGARSDLYSSASEALRGTIDLHAEQGTMTKQDRDMLGGILDLADVEVRAVMTHRRSMETIDTAQPPRQVLEQVVASPYSRFPVWRGESESIIGVLHAKDLLTAVQEHGADLEELKLDDLCQRPWFVPDTTPLKRQLIAFRQRRQHLALVVDEYGDLEGLVTLEDVIEEIVGEIADETDVESEGIEAQADGSYLVSGWVTVRDLNRARGWKLPDEEAATIAGLVIHEAQRIPEVGQSFAFHGFRFLVLRRQRNQIVLLKVIPPGVGGAEVGAGASQGVGA